MIVSKMIYKSHREDRGPDINGDDRKRIIFELAIDSSLHEGNSDFTSTETVEKPSFYVTMSKF